jgi:hypothetical protein
MKHWQNTSYRLINELYQKFLKNVELAHFMFKDVLWQ